MYERIIVALDGSPLAEQVLPHVEALAEKFGSTVHLVQATMGAEAISSATGSAMTGAMSPIDPLPLIEAEASTAEEYLGRVAARLRARGIAVEQEHPEGGAHEVIVQRARELPASLIAMTTNGRSGLGRVVFGSVAESVLRHAPCPVLLVRLAP